MRSRSLLALALAASLAMGAAEARQSPAPAANVAPAPAVPASVADASAAVPAAVPAAIPAAIPGAALPANPAAGSLLQTILALCLVLALLAGLAWFLKRYGPKASANSAQLRLVGALNLGGRERIMVVEVGEQWIVVGASPGRVNALASMPRPPGAEPPTLNPQQSSASSFAEWLKQTIDKRNAK